MAKKGKPKNTNDALGSIFDFLFKEAKKKKASLKPPKYNNISNSSILSAQMVELMSKPGIYLSEGALRSLNVALGQVYLDMYIGKKSPDDDSGRLRVRTSDLGQLLSNPKKYIDSVFAAEAAANKFDKYMGFARGLDTAMTFAWAMKNRIDIKTAGTVSAASGNFVSLDMRNDAYKKLAQNIAMTNLSSSPDKAMKVVDLLEKAKTGDFSENNLFKILSGPGGFSQAEARNIANLIALRHVNSPQSDPKESSKYYLPSYRDYEMNMSPVGYRAITAENLLNKAKLIDVSKARTPAEAAKLRKMKEDLIKSANLILVMQKTQGSGLDKASFAKQAELITQNTRKEYEEVKNLINKYRYMPNLSKYEKDLFNAIDKRINELSKNVQRANQNVARNIINTASFNSRDNALFRDTVLKEIDALEKKFQLEILVLQKNDPKGSKQRITELESQLENLRLQKVFFDKSPNGDLAARLGNIRNAWNSFNANIIKGGLATNLLLGGRGFHGTGDIFDPSVGSAIAVNKNLFKIVKDKDGNDVKVYEKVGIILPNSSIMSGYKNLSYLYYLNPGVLFGSFFNGEIYAFLQYKRREAFINDFGNAKTVAKMKAAGIFNLFDDYLDSSGELDISKLQDMVMNNPEKYLELLDKISKSRTQFAKYAKRFATFENALSRISSTFSFVSRTTAKISQALDPLQRFPKLREGVKKFLVSIFKDNFAVEQFLQKSIGLRQLIKIGVDKLLTSLGFSVGGPIGGVIAAIVSGFLVDLGMKIVKIITELSFFIVFGILVIILSFLFYFLNIKGPLTKSSATYSYVVPGTAEKCVDYNPDTGLVATPPDNPEGGDYPPNDSDCPLGFSPIICKQGNGAGTSKYHQTTKAIDIGTRPIPPEKAVWYAPTNGKIIKYVPVNICAGTGLDYGGHLEFQDSDGNIYVLLHVKALAPIGNVQKGRAVAIAQTELDSSGDPELTCWSGPHFHLHVKSKGKYQDSLSWYRDKLRCSMSPC